MFDSLKSVPASDLIALVIAGAILAALLLRKAGYLVLPSDRPVKRPAGGELPFTESRARQWFEQLQARQQQPAAPPSVPEIPTIRPTEPRSAQALLEDHRSVQAELQKRKQWHESELKTIDSVLGLGKTAG
jgi:hypothetical protein